ncbi:F-box protein [Trichinella spiralis]|uniref:F-box protein n=1 Tax=Trichinella spiralis TaxID=6334 RepID=A0ABR3KZJ7_TRISP
MPRFNLPWVWRIVWFLLIGRNVLPKVAIKFRTGLPSVPKECNHWTQDVPLIHPDILADEVKIDNRRVSVMPRLVLMFIGTSCLLWLAYVLYLVILPPFFESSADPYYNSDVDQHLLKRLEEAIAEVNTLRQQSDSIQQAFDVLQ